MKLIALALLCTGCVSLPSTDNFGRPFEQWVPADVRLFVINAQACTHFTGEYAFNEERKAFLDRMIEETCPGLDKRKTALSHKYSGSAQIKELISEVWDQ